MAIAAEITPGAETVGRAPSSTGLWAVSAAGLLAAACSVLLALTSDHIREPGVHGVLQAWGVLGYVFAGVIGWWLRPDSRFGPLLVAAGTGWFLSSLSSSNLALPVTAS
jgi:hypothetical protein